MNKKDIIKYLENRIIEYTYKTLIINHISLTISDEYYKHIFQQDKKILQGKTYGYMDALRFLHTDYDITKKIYATALLEAEMEIEKTPNIKELIKNKKANLQDYELHFYDF